MGAVCLLFFVLVEPPHPFQKQGPTSHLAYWEPKTGSLHILAAFQDPI